jgi:hypothetical protein
MRTRRPADLRAPCSVGASQQGEHLELGLPVRRASEVAAAPTAAAGGRLRIERFQDAGVDVRAARDGNRVTELLRSPPKGLHDRIAPLRPLPGRFPAASPFAVVARSATSSSAATWRSASKARTVAVHVRKSFADTSSVPAAACR